MYHVYPCLGHKNRTKIPQFWSKLPLAGMGLRLVCPRRGAGAVPAAAEATEAAEPLFREELKRLEQPGLNPWGFIAGCCGFR